MSTQQAVAYAARVLSPDEEAELLRLAAEKDARLERLHRRIVELYQAHRDDPDRPVTQR